MNTTSISVSLLAKAVQVGLIVDLEVGPEVPLAADPGLVTVDDHVAIQNHHGEVGVNPGILMAYPYTLSLNGLNQALSVCANMFQEIKISKLF